MEFPERLVPVMVGLVDRLIPADEFPSASENGVLDFLRKQWGGAMAGEQGMIVRGLEGLEAAGLVGMGDAEKDAFLKRVEKGELGAEMRRFFERMVELAAEGYYADPGNGGNAEMVSWKMMGFVP